MVMSWNSGGGGGGDAAISSFPKAASPVAKRVRPRLVCAEAARYSSPSVHYPRRPSYKTLSLPSILHLLLIKIGRGDE